MQRATVVLQILEQINMNKRQFIASASIFLSSMGFSHAETADEIKVQSLVKSNFGESKKIAEVKKTPYLGLYEIQIDKHVIYTDSNAKYYFIGHIFNPKEKKDYTENANEKLENVKFSKLPFGLAISTVHGNGKRKIAVFEDPNCGYCKKYQSTLRSLKNVTIYTFLFNVIAQNSSLISTDIWCSIAWDDWMTANRLPRHGDTRCVAPNEQILDLGHKLNISGTPTTIFPDGTRTMGLLDTKAIQRELAHQL